MKSEKEKEAFSSRFTRRVIQQADFGKIVGLTVLWCISLCPLCSVGLSWLRKSSPVGYAALSAPPPNPYWPSRTRCGWPCTREGFHRPYPVGSGPRLCVFLMPQQIESGLCATAHGWWLTVSTLCWDYFLRVNARPTSAYLFRVGQCTMATDAYTARCERVCVLCGCV